jgi:hypothetical protein
MSKPVEFACAYPWEIADLLVGAYLQRHQRPESRAATPNRPRDPLRNKGRVPNRDGSSMTA